MAECSAFLNRHAREDLMSELETKAETEVDKFNDELSDEALDRERSGGGRVCAAPCINDG